MDHTPKRVVQTAHGIQAIIDRGQPGDQLPSEVELAKQLTVSRATVRDALTRLWLQGLVTRRWGAGTFISERHALLDTPISTIFLDLEEVGSLPNRIADAGHTPTIVSFESSAVEPPLWIAEEFQMAKGEKLRCIQRCIAVDGQPAIFLRDYFPLLVRGRELPVDGLSGLSGDFPALFRAAGLRLIKQAARIDAQLPDKTVAATFEILQSQPVLHAEQRSYAETGEIIICTDAYYMTEIFSMILVRALTS